MPSASEKTTRQAGSYPQGGEEIWNEFLFQFFGDEELGYPGFLGLTEEKQEWLQNTFSDAWENYYNTISGIQDDYLSELEKAGGMDAQALSEYEQAMGSIQPINISFGGQPGVSIIPQRPQEKAGRLYSARTGNVDRLLDYALKEMSTESLLPTQAFDLTTNLAPTFAPQNPQLAYLGNLGQQAFDIQKLRYGTPSVTTTGEVDRGFLATLGDVINLGGSTVDFLDKLKSVDSDLNPLNWDWSNIDLNPFS